MKRRRCLALLLALSSCSAGAAEGPGGRSLRVGSKAFTESVILGEVVQKLLSRAGLPAEHRRQLGGTQVLFAALQGGAIDVYPEYTGTLSEQIFAREAPADRAALEGLLAARGVRMGPPLGFSDSYAVAVTARVAADRGLRRVSDLKAHPDLRFGFSSEFMERADGWPGLRRRYELPQRQVTGLVHDLAYRGIQAGNLDGTEVYTTDPEIRSYDLRVLEDDLGYFPPYEAVLLYRQDLPPAALAALAALAGRVDQATMIGLNARARIGRVPEDDVAAAFLQERLGVIAPASRAPSWLRDLSSRTREHLQLVGISLLLAVLIGVPLGVLSARRPRAGQVLLAAVGVVQTLPSLALLVFMIPLLGIGTLPALVALFLYSLLPIVRGTYTGLREIPGPLRESAEALGLPASARLLRIELPLAARSILAGVKTAAVINIGTATIGALIGAGGYGQPILTGIRLDDTGLILQGAVPAALLALLCQALFELLERAIVPRGLRVSATAPAKDRDREIAPS